MTLTLVRLYHDLLGTYGDQGNAEILAFRAAARGLAVELVEIGPGQVVPTGGDIYLVGGGEDGPQLAALELLAADGGLGRAVAGGATVLAVCAGMQMIGSSLPGRGGAQVAGLGLVDMETRYTADPRSVGEVVVRYHGAIEGDPILTGFENHQGLTRLGPGVTPLGSVLAGVGNGLGQHTEGVHQGNVFGTYLHGPVLARNPQLADLVLSSAVGVLAPFDDPWAHALAAERRGALFGGVPR